MTLYYLFLNLLHLTNDGYKAGLILLLPFIAKEFHLSLTEVGFLATVSNSLTTILAIPSGYFSGKVGGMKILIISSLVYALGFIFIGFVHTPFFLPITFFFASLGFGAFHTVSYPMLIRITKPEEKGKKMGEYTAVGDAGKIGISSLTTYLANLVGWHLAAIYFGFIALALSLFTYFFAKADYIYKNDIPEKSESETFKEHLKNRNFIYANIAGSFDCFASGSLYIFIPFLLLQRHVPLSWLGFFTAIFFVGNIGGKTILGRAMDRYGTTGMFIASEIFMALFIVLLSLSQNFILIALTATILGAFTKGTSPIVTIMVSESVKHKTRIEKAFALNNFTISGANTLAPIVLGYLADRFGISNAFIISAAFALLASVPVLLIHIQRKKETIVVVEEFS